MRVAARFACPSVSLALSALLRKSTGVLWVCLGLGVGIHLCFTAIRSLEAEQKVSKPLTTQFVKRAPRLTKPLELKKRPQPRRRQVEREMVAVQAKARQDQRITTVGAAQVVGALSRPRADVSRIAVFRGTGMEPQEMAQRIESAKEPAHRVDLSLEMMDVQAMDTGEFQAMVIQDPSDKTNIRGFFHMARLQSNSMDFVATSESLVWTEYIKTNSMVRLAEAVNQYTGIVTDYRDTFTPDDRKLLGVPLVFLMPTSKFEVTENESRNLGEYMVSGGMIFGDHGHPQQITSIREAIERALATQGLGEKEWEEERLPNQHALFHCFFEFDAPPPGGREWSNKEVGLWHGLFDACLRGVALDGRLVAIISEKWYTFAWGAFGLVPSSRWTTRDLESADPTRPLQLGVNLIVFALTQEGSITNRLMDTVAY